MQMTTPEPPQKDLGPGDLLALAKPWDISKAPTFGCLATNPKIAKGVNPTPPAQVSLLRKQPCPTQGSEILALQPFSQKGVAVAVAAPVFLFVENEKHIFIWLQLSEHFSVNYLDIWGFFST